MKAWWRLLAWSLAGALAAGFVACSSEVETSSAGASSGSATAGSGGAGGSSASSTGGAGGIDVMLTCDQPIASFKDTQCDFLNQDCPFGEACMPVTFQGNTTTKCQPWAGVKPFGAPCTLHDECKPGLFCGFYCAPPCCRATDDPCMGAGCNFTATFEGAQKADICNLAPQCDLFQPDKCADMKDCHFDSKQGIAICTPITGNVPEPTEGLDCTYLNDCGEMQVCNSGKCAFSCDVAKQSEMPGLGGCRPGEKCSQYQPEVKIYPTLGICVPD